MAWRPSFTPTLRYLHKKKEWNVQLYFVIKI
jgi:hypothetical protein